MKLSVVLPVYNEAEGLSGLFDELRPALDGLGVDWEMILVDDGSTDGSDVLVREAASADPRVKLVGFSRNFGHQAAITAGLDFATGDAVVVMDADLQDPPELLGRMLALQREGYDVVSAQRIARDGETRWKRWSAAAFYALMRRAVDPRLQPQVGDFRMFSRRAVDAVIQLREQHRFLRGMVAWLGLKEAIVPFRRAPRATGVTKFPTWRMARFAWTAITSSSALPLRLNLAIGMVLTLGGLLYLAYVLVAALALRQTVPGWASLVGLQVLFSGATLTAVGLVGDYVARIYEESKGRPLYIVSQTRNLEPTDRASVAATTAAVVLEPVEVGQ